MRIPMDQLPPPILERLKAVQTNPSAYDCFYKKEGGRGGAIFGLVVAGLAVPALLLWAVNEYLPAAVAIIAGLLVGAIAWFSVSRLRRFGSAEIQPMVFVNPLYFARVTLDRVTCHGLWSELRDLKITHHHTNGVYTHTMFEFFFKKGARETLAVSPKNVAEDLANLIEHYRVRMIEAIESDNVEEIIGHDLFLEARTPDEAGRQPKFRGNKKAVRKRWLLAWGLGGAAGAVVGLGLFFLSYAGVQSRMIRHCYGVTSCQAYFEAFQMPFYTDRAQDKLTETYKREWRRNKKSVRKLREMAKLERVDWVTPAQQKEILKMYVDDSKAELRAQYQKAIDKYKRVSTRAYPQARAALIKMLELARDKGYYRVKLSYQGVTEKIKGKISLPKKARGRTLVSMAPSFTDKLNKSRESLITRRIHRAFMELVPQDVLEFPGLQSGRYSSRYSSRRGSYRNRLNRYGSLTRKLGLDKDKSGLDKDKSATKDAGKDTGPAELEFKVAYVVFPSGSMYVSRKNPSKLYMGIGFDWLVRIVVKGDTLYTLRKQSYPPPRFTVSSYGSSRYTKPILGAGTVYSKMASTAFDNFSKKIVNHFGIPVSKRPAPRRYRSKTGRGLRNTIQDRVRSRLRSRLAGR